MVNKNQTFFLSVFKIFYDLFRFNSLIEKIKLIEETFSWFLSVPKIGNRSLIRIERKTQKLLIKQKRSW